MNKIVIRLNNGDKLEILGDQIIKKNCKKIVFRDAETDKIIVIPMTSVLGISYFVRSIPED